MAIRMSGMISGLDTESIVKSLMETQQAKKTKIESKKQKLEWKQEIWSGLNTKIPSRESNRSWARWARRT